MGEEEERGEGEGQREGKGVRAQHFALFSLPRTSFAFCFLSRGVFSLNCGRGPLPPTTKIVRLGCVGTDRETPASARGGGGRVGEEGVWREGGVEGGRGASREEGRGGASEGEVQSEASPLTFNLLPPSKKKTGKTKKKHRKKRKMMRQQYSSHARHVYNHQQHWHKFLVTPEYREVFSYVTFLLLYFQPRVNWCSCASVVIFSSSGEINSLSQSCAVFCPECVVQ